MKRSAELRDLSEEHHHGLVEARRLRKAAAGEVPLEEAVELFLGAWREEIGPHFRAEEEVLLPLYSAAAGAENAGIVRTLTEHVALRLAVYELERSAGERRRE